MSSAAGLLITFEGPEGSGKSTLIRNLDDRLRATGIEPVIVREPGGSEIGERIRNILLDPASDRMCAETELLLMVASRAQLVREILRPSLSAGHLVICDRFADASVAYQGYGRELGEETVHALNEVALGGLVPDLTFLCLLPPEQGRARLVDRQTDRLDRESVEFHDRVYSGYESMAASGDPRFFRLDAAATPQEILEGTWARLRRLEHPLLAAL